MKLETFLVAAVIWSVEVVDSSGNVTDFGNSGSETVRVHSRQKRYLVFPKGASLQMILELLFHVPTRYKAFVGPTLQLAWPLPDEPSDKSSLLLPLKDPLTRKQFRVSSRYSKGNLWMENKYKMLNELAAAFNLFGTTIGLAWQLPDDPMIYSEFKKKHKIYKRNALKKMESFMRPGGANGKQCVLKALCESGQRTSSKKEFLTEILHRIFSYNAEDEDVNETHEDKIYRKAHRSTNQNCETLYPDCSFSVFNAIK